MEHIIEGTNALKNARLCSPKIPSSSKPMNKTKQHWPKKKGNAKKLLHEATSSYAKESHPMSKRGVAYTHKSPKYLPQETLYIERDTWKIKGDNTWRQEREAVRRAYYLTQPYHHRLLPNDVIIQAISRVSGPRIHRHGTSPCAVYRLPG